MSLRTVTRCLHCPSIGTQRHTDPVTLKVERVCGTCKENTR